MNDIDIDAMDARINRLGADLFFDPITLAAAADRGIDNPFVLYAGRAGVMGDVAADLAVSALCFFEPTMVHDVWAGLSAYGTPSHVGEVFASSMSVAAEHHWDPDAARTVARIGSTVINSVPAMGMALFAGWRALARNGAPCMVLHALRELRGDVHIQSVAAAGVHPAAADMATRGEAVMQLHGWKPPYPDPATVTDALALATETTSARMASIYRRALTTTELHELTAAVMGLVPTPAP